MSRNALPAWDETEPLKNETVSRGTLPAWDETQVIEPEIVDGPPSKLEAFTRGAAQGGSFGFADEITGAGATAVDALKGDIGVSDIVRDYLTRRDKSRSNYSAAKDAHPGTFLAGQLGGGAVTALAAPELSIPKLIGMGAVQGVGESDAPVFSGETIKDAAIGAGVGGAAGVAGKAVSNLINPNVLDTIAERQGAKALGAQGSTFNKYGEDRLRQMARVALDSPVEGKTIITPFASTDDMIARAAALNKISGSKIGETMEVIDNAGIRTYRPSNVMKGFQSDVQSEVGNLRDPALAGYRPKYKNMLGSLDRHQRVEKLGTAQDYKGMLQKLSYGERATLQPGQEITDIARRNVKNEMERAIEEGVDSLPTWFDAERVGNKKILTDYLAAKKQYGATETMEDILGRKLSREMGNNSATLTDTIVGAGALPHGVGAALEAGGANHMTKKLWNPAASWSADRFSKAIKVSPQTFQKWLPNLQSAMARGPQALAVTTFMLQQTDPDFTAVLEGDGHGQ